MRNKMRLFVLMSFLLLSAGVFSQTTVSGKVSDKKAPVVGVSLTLKDTYDGATTDSAGRFSFKTFEKGEYTFLATAVGYKPYEQKIKLEGGNLEIDILLKEEITELKAVVVTAGTFEASDKKRAGVVLNSIDIVTTASANADVTQALKTLPGAQQVGETEGLFVRGGTAAETKIFIDGTLVNKFFYSTSPNVAGYGRFSPFIFKGTVFSTGGYSALYGQALSSAVILESIDLPERTSASLSLSPLGIGGGLQYLNKNKTASWGFDLNYVNLGPTFNIIKQKQDYFKMPVIEEAHLNFRFKTSKTGMVKFYGNYSANQFGFHVPSIDSLGFLNMFKLKNYYAYQNLAWKENLGSGWKINLGISYTYNYDDIHSHLQNTDKNTVAFFKNFDATPIGNYINSKLVLEKKLKGLSALRFGSEYNYANDRAKFIDYNNNEYKTHFTDNTKAFFTEADVYITNALAAKFGTRLEHSGYVGKVNIAPRISLAYKTGKNSQASVAYGFFYQNPETRYLPTNYNVGYLKAAHYIAQYMATTALTVFRIEGYYKKYHNLLKTGFDNGREVATGNNGYGDAKGFEIFWRDKKTMKNLDYWVSYSYLDTKRNFLNFPYAITPNYAARHTASVVLKKFVMNWKTGFNLAYNFSSKRPYYNIAYSGSAFKITDQGKVPPYHNVSFSLNYIPSIGKQNARSFAVYVLSVNNIFNIRQTFGYEYSYNGLRKQPIVPTSRMFVYIGAFFSFGIDRTQDAINNNL